MLAFQKYFFFFWFIFNWFWFTASPTEIGLNVLNPLKSWVQEERDPVLNPQKLMAL